MYVIVCVCIRKYAIFWLKSSVARDGSVPCLIMGQKVRAIIIRTAAGPGIIVPQARANILARAITLTIIASRRAPAIAVSRNLSVKATAERAVITRGAKAGPTRAVPMAIIGLVAISATSAATIAT